jgi:hypothetical protein
METVVVYFIYHKIFRLDTVQDITESQIWSSQ